MGLTSKSCFVIENKILFSSRLPDPFQVTYLYCTKYEWMIGILQAGWHQIVVFKTARHVPWSWNRSVSFSSSIRWIFPRPSLFLFLILTLCDRRPRRSHFSSCEKNEWSVSGSSVFHACNYNNRRLSKVEGRQQQLQPLTALRGENQAFLTFTIRMNK